MNKRISYHIGTQVNPRKDIVKIKGTKDKDTLFFK